MTQRDGRGRNASSTASNQIELSGYSTWLTRSYHAEKRGFNRTVVALANKTARVAWALLTRKEAYVAA